MNNENNLYAGLKDKRILITGAGGMISSNVMRVIQRLNNTYDLRISVIAHVHNQEQAEKLIRNPLEGVDRKIVVGDIRSLAVDDDVDYIIHTAGITGGSQQHIDAPMNTISVAIDGTVRVLEIAREKRVKSTVYLSSLEVYGKSDGSKQTITEEDGGYIDPTNVRSSYPESKRMCECICASYTKQFQVPTVIARLTATFGYGVDYRDNRVFSQFARSILAKEDIVLRSTGKTVRNYCDAEDTAFALLFLLLYGKHGEAYNVANMSTEISIKDLAERFVALYPESGSSLRFDLRTDAASLGYNAEMRNVLDSGKLMELGWRPIYQLDEMIAHLMASMQDSLKQAEQKGAES